MHYDTPRRPADDRTVSAISHLFLSDDAPQTSPAGEGVAVIGSGAASSALFEAQAASVAAGMLSDDVQSVAVAHADARGLKLVCVARHDPDAWDAATDANDDTPRLSAPTPRVAARHLKDLAHDVDAWVIALKDARHPAAAVLLAACGHWTLATTADHEGVVAGYRTLKGLCDRPGVGMHGPRVTIALPADGDPAEGERAARKLAGVCRQFLDVGVAGVTNNPPATHDAGRWTTCVALDAAWHTSEDASSLWAVLASLAKETREAADVPPRPHPAPTAGRTRLDAPVRVPPADVARPRGSSRATLPDTASLAALDAEADADVPTIDDAFIPKAARPAAQNPLHPQQQAPAPLHIAAGETAVARTGPAEVIDLPVGLAGDTEADEAWDVAAAAAGRDPDLALTPINVPMLPGAHLAVARDGGVVLVAAASARDGRGGLGNLGAVADAVAWVRQNRQLLAMALGHYRVDPRAEVRTRLYVSHADAASGSLRPLLATGGVEVCIYRRITWAGRTGVLLDAA